MDDANEYVVPLPDSLNKKIEKYDKSSSNPFSVPQPIVLIWVDDNNNEITLKYLLVEV